MARASADNRRCKDKGPHPHRATSLSVWLSPPRCLSQNQSSSLSFFLSHTGSSPFSSPLSHPFSISLAQSIPLTPTTISFLFLQCSPSSLPCLLQQKIQHRHQHVCVCTCVCATTVDPRAKAHRIMSKEGREIKSPHTKKKKALYVRRTPWSKHWLPMRYITAMQTKPP